jgi:hypothetical protein
MRVKLQLVMCDDEGHETTVTDVVTLKKDTTRLEHLGLTLKEAKQLLKTIQKKLLEQQIDRFLATQSQCPDCGATLKAKSYTHRSFRTLFGTFKLPSPRLVHCCAPQKFIRRVTDRLVQPALWLPQQQPLTVRDSTRCGREDLLDFACADGAYQGKAADVCVRIRFVKAWHHPDKR